MSLEKPYLTIQEVAQRFRLNATTVYRLARERKLPAFKVGGQWRFSLSALDAWTADQIAESSSRPADRQRQEGR